MEQLCPKKNECGSCGWSHIPYQKQLTQKLADINGSFKIKGLDLICDKILPAEKTSHYRNRMDFVIDFKGQVGLREKGKWWRVIDNHTCFIADEQIEKLFSEVRDWVKDSGLSYFDRKSLVGLLRYAVIRATKKGETLINIITSSPQNNDETKQIETALHDLAEKTHVTSLVWSINHTDSDISVGDEIKIITGPGFIQEEINGFHYRISPNAFFQTNSYSAHLLQNTMFEFVGDLSGKTVMDLYCGSGFFSIPLAKAGAIVIGVEMVPEAIADAKINAVDNQVEVEFHDAKTEEFDWQSSKPDILILDPPRSGMHDKALSDIITALPKTIIYVSCNPKNFAREMVQLQKFYRVENMTAIDMFPHTPHVELISKLVRI